MSNPIFEITYTNKDGKQFSQMYASLNIETVEDEFYIVRPRDAGYEIVSIRPIGGKQ